MLEERHLLVIDDEVEITKSLMRQFRRTYKVHTAISGTEALGIMEKKPIQVVLSDQRMPGMTGVDFFSRIKDKFPDALKLILTGYSDIEAVVGAINEGQVFRYLTKPWNPLDLEIAVKEAFDKHDLIYRNKQLMKELHEANKNLEHKVKERTQELESANDRLKDLNIEKNKYIGMVAHDLRNPIGNACVFTELMVTDFAELSEEEHIEFLQVVNERCEYALKLIEDFLDASKIEAGILDLNFKKHNYYSLLNACIAQNKTFAKKKSQKLILKCKNETLSVLCDGDKLQQVINNLLSNAIKYSLPDKEICLEAELHDDKILTRVVDRGQGIPADELESIFKPFKTSSVKATAEEKSTGLGLAIVKKMVEAHNGQLEVKSEVGVGSVFSFSLPIS